MRILLSVVLTILACDRIANGYRILGVFPLHGKSHWVMKEELMKGLAQRGHQVDVITHFPLKEPMANYTEINLAGSLHQVVNNVTAEDIKMFNSVSLYNLAQVTGMAICELLNHAKLRNLIENPPQDPPYDLVIVEVFVAPCYLAFGRYLGIPMVATVSSSFHSWLDDVSGNPSELAFVPNFFMSFTQQMNFKDRVLNVLTFNWLSLQLHYYTNAQLSYVKEHFGLDVPHITDLYRDISLYLVNSHHSLNGIRPMTPSVVEVGGLHFRKDEPLIPEVKKWLDESEHGCVFFTFGSMVRIETFPDKVIKEIYASFEKIAPVRVLMKVAKKEDLMPGLPKNVMTYSWFPQISVLKHKNVRAFITHGGLMGTQEAVICAVPMIGIPLFGDQSVNINNYAKKKVAIAFNSVDDITEEKLTLALNNILKDPSYRENVRKLSKLFLDRPMSPLDTSIYWVEYVAKFGNVLQSPALHMYWWQRKLLDVYAFIFVVIIMVFYVALFILRKLKNCLFGSRACANKNNVAKKNE